MARAPLSTESSRVYVGMLIVTCVAMLVGILVMAMECGEYDWEKRPPTSPTVALPGPRAPKKVEAPAGNTGLVKPVDVADAPKSVEPEATPAPIPTPLLFPGR